MKIVSEKHIVRGGGRDRGGTLSSEKSIIPTALRSVSDGGGGGDFRFLATTENKKNHAETDAGQS